MGNEKQTYTHTCEMPRDTDPAPRKGLLIGLGLLLGYMVAEVAGGILANSLALLADAGHMLADASAVGLALLAMWIASRPVTREHTFGFLRAEVLAASINSTALLVIAATIIYEAYIRLAQPPDVKGVLVLTIGIGGLLINIAIAGVLRHQSHGNVSVESVLLHVFSDLLGSIGVVVGGILLWAFNWHLADPILGFIIGGLVIISAARLLARVVRILMESTPQDLDVSQIVQRFSEQEGVSGVHDVHVWAITPDYRALTAHVTISDGSPTEASDILTNLRALACSEFNITHITIQMEYASAGAQTPHH